MQLGATPALKPGAIVQNAGVAEVAGASGLAMQPFIIEQTAPAGAEDSGLVHDWPAPDLGVDKHRGYAFQWYALAVMAVLFFVVTGYRRGK
jgi:cytochrome oxidase assembly protein ShyY1